MAQDQNHLAWIDMEMTGLSPERDRIIEIALVITNAQLEVLAQCPVMVVHQPEAIMQSMDAWNTSTHTRSGLIERVKASSLDEAQAEAQIGRAHV